MIDIINDIFVASGFMPQQTKDGVFYKSTSIEQYWLVVKKEADLVLEKQSSYFETCKNLCLEPSLDKNISMLVLWETDGKVEKNEFKRKKMGVEEDPYYFKKYVLGYSSEEANELKQKIGECDVSDYVSATIVSKEIFDKYKEEPFVKTWYSLLYRIAIKVPFLEIKIGESEGLQSLFEENDEALKGENLLALNDELREQLNMFSLSEIKNLMPDEVVKRLVSLGGGGE